MYNITSNNYINSANNRSLIYNLEKSSKFLSRRGSHPYIYIIVTDSNRYKGKSYNRGLYKSYCNMYHKDSIYNSAKNSVVQKNNKKSTTKSSNKDKIDINQKLSEKQIYDFAKKKIHIQNDIRELIDIRKILDDKIKLYKNLPEQDKKNIEKCAEERKKVQNRLEELKKIYEKYYCKSK